MSASETVLTLLLLLDHWVLVGGLSILCVLGGALVWHGVQHVRLRKMGLAREAALLSRALPPDAELPHVLVQIPTFNEGVVIGRAAGAVGELDWPRDKLHIQLLDDSTDGSVEAARAAVAALRARGLDATLLHREDRRGFKAAALQAGLAQSTAEYVVGFDADFVAPRDFLRQCMRVLLADPGLAFVQARWDAINADQNALTRAQQRIIDVFFHVEIVRSWSGHLVTYHGSGGVWRRAAIDDLGGLTSDILPEDLDISLRALLRGWRAEALATTAVPGELPDTTAAWLRQQYRWNNGLAQAMRKYLWVVLGSRLTAPRKLLVLTHLINSLFGVLLGIAVTTALLEVLLTGGLTTTVWTLAAVGAAETCLGAIGLFLLSQRLLRGTDPWRELPKTLTSVAVFVYAQLASMQSLLDALRGKAWVWLPTPKKGATPPLGRSSAGRG
jgi:cellulose synthase/poly-beta-1,6-N-acetylglucosamine synthase-like glycosyltransferase